jgi:hypothetical protein
MGEIARLAPLFSATKLIGYSVNSEGSVTARYRMHSMNATGGKSMNVDQ